MTAKDISAKTLVMVLVIITMTCINAFSAERSSYAALSGKAERAYAYEEWASASALYGLMINERPTDTRLYGRAIVSAAMREKPAEEVELLRKAISAHVAFDSVFASVRRESFAIGQTDLYENFMKEVRVAEPWLKRTVNGYLLDYYVYRRNAKGMISYANELLEAVPDNERFLYILAQGYLLDGMTNEAVIVWERILGVNPKSYDALLFLGNYFADNSVADNAGDTLRALDYLNRAQEVKATPYVAERIKSLNRSEIMTK